MKTLEMSIELLSHFRDFRKEFPEGDLNDFSGWLHHYFQKADDSGRFSEQMPFDFQGQSVENYIGWIWGRLLKFSKIWEKKAFEAVELANLDEFGLLMFVQLHPGCSKSEVAQASLMEKSTCFEILKRLAQKGLIAEKENQSDKRNKKLLLSKKGQQQLADAFVISKEISNWLVKALLPHERIELIQLLIKLDHFHQKAVIEMEGVEWAKIIKQTNY